MSILINTLHCLLPFLDQCIFKKDTVPLTHGKVYEFMSASFTPPPIGGGSTEMYKPFGKNIRSLDINSLYPSMMSKWDFGVGTIYQF